MTSPSNAELLLKEEISLTFGNGSGDGKAYCDIEDIFLWVFAHDQAHQQQLLSEVLALIDKHKVQDGEALHVIGAELLAHEIKSKIGELNG